MPELPALLAGQRQIEEARVAMPGEDQRLQVQLGGVGAMRALGPDRDVCGEANPAYDNQLPPADHDPVPERAGTPCREN